MFWVLIGVVLLLMISNIVADLKGLKSLKYLTKPSVMIAIIVTLFLAGPPHNEAFRWVILAGLVFSLAGDVFLMFEKDLFIWGLGSFLIAHIFYVVAFAMDVPWDPSQVLWLLPFALIAVIMMMVLWRRLPAKLRLPVIIYVLALVFMGWFAARRFDAGLFDTQSAALCLIGAVLFLISDGVLSVRRFIEKKPLYQVIVLGTYFPAQLCFAIACCDLSKAL
ncbi:MAG: lysoplasmalogenase [Planctomycetota bacterium]|nr:lysoplasmalogenase [Planctomycetota bacterium]